MYTKILISLTAVFFLSLVRVYSQGCSDAGVCSIGNIESNHYYENDSLKNIYTIRLSQSVGSGEQGVINSLSMLDFNMTFKKN